MVESEIMSKIKSGIFWNYLLYFLSFLMPRMKKKWVFGSYIVDQFNDNPKYLFLHVSLYHPELRAIWITKDDRIYQDLLSKGFQVYKQESWKGIYHCLTAKVYYYNAFPEDINFFTSGGAVLVNLWHGIGLKKIEFNIKRGILAACYRDRKWEYRLYSPWRFKRPTYLLSSTDFQSIPFSSAFRIPIKRCLNLGYPRNDLMFMTDDERFKFIDQVEPRETMALLEKLKSYSKVYMYTPTWRESKTFLIDLQVDFHLIDEVLKSKNALLILKLHINSVPVATEGLSNVILLPYGIDVYTILPYTHTLITDYSSILYDYLLLPGKEIILFLFDLESHLTNSDFNYSFLSNVAGKVITSVPELYETLRTEDPLGSINDLEEIRTRFWGTYNGHASREITDTIKNKLNIYSDSGC
jgi:CDP-glycerol glycerophosphotransferase (TagB/SpsB family)